MRTLIIITQIGNWASVAAVPKIYNGQIFLPPDISATRDATLFFSIVGFIMSIGFYLLYLFNIPSINRIPFNRVPVVIIVSSYTISNSVLTPLIISVHVAVRVGHRLVHSNVHTGDHVRSAGGRAGQSEQCQCQ
jgi:hypothetical protein